MFTAVISRAQKSVRADRDHVILTLVCENSPYAHASIKYYNRKKFLSDFPKGVVSSKDWEKARRISLRNDQGTKKWNEIFSDKAINHSKVDIKKIIKIDEDSDDPTFSGKISEITMTVSVKK